ncbi:hypothetical protein F5Y01DRAFT_194504 [Xylaria sp. FL0043]|nr:hypothetical protein F5Y01DRAFT_194504 [Xylaria sp. FL0043]
MFLVIMIAVHGGVSGYGSNYAPGFSLRPSAVMAPVNWTTLDTCGGWGELGMTLDNLRCGIDTLRFLVAVVSTPLFLVHYLGGKRRFSFALLARYLALNDKHLLSST